MAILNLFGFDMYPGKDDGAGLPVLRAGLDNTAYQAALRSNRTVDARNAVGVSGLAQHRLGFGNMARNGLLVRRAGTGATFVGTNQLTTETRKADVAVGKTWSMNVSTTFKILAETNTNGQTPTILALGDPSGALLSNILSIRTNAATPGTFILQAGNLTLPVATMVLVADREYHVECKLYRTPTHAVNAFAMEVRIDGEVVFTTNTYFSSANYGTAGFTYIVGQSAINSIMTYSVLFADLVISDNSGATFTDWVGPTMILPNRVTAVTPNGWEKEGAALPVPTLSDADDTTFFTSPLDASAMSVKLEGAPTAFKSLCTEVYIRANRDRDAGRALQIGVRGAGDVELAPDLAMAVTTALTDTRVARLEGKAEADMRNNTVRLKAVAP